MAHLSVFMPFLLSNHPIFTFFPIFFSSPCVFSPLVALQSSPYLPAPQNTPDIKNAQARKQHTIHSPFDSSILSPSASYRPPVFFIHWLLKSVLCAVVPDKPRGAPYRQKMLVSQSYTLNSAIGSHLSRVIAADKSIAQLTKTNTAQNHPRIHLLFVIPYSSSLKFSSKSYTAVDFHLSMGYNENRKVCTNVHFCSHFHSERIAP